MWQPQHRISEGADHPGMAYLRNVGRTQRPPDCNAQQNGGGHRRRFCRCRPVLAILELMCPSQALGWQGRSRRSGSQCFQRSRQIQTDRRLLHVSARQGARTRNFGMSSKCRTLRQVGRARCGTDTLRPPQPYSYGENWGSERE
jgi:hypothetical protein